MTGRMQDANGPAGIPADLIELGRIVGAHGVRGQVKVQSHDTYSDLLRSASTWWMQPFAPAHGGIMPPPRAVRVTKCQLHGISLVAQLEGIADRDQAQALKGTALFLPRSAFPKPDTDEYYWVDLIGCLLHGEDADGKPMLLGRVTQVSDNGAHGVLHVARLAPADGAPADAAQTAASAEPALEPVLDARGRAQELLVPFVAAHVLHVDLAARRIDSNWPADF